MEDVYAREMMKQNEYKNNNSRLASDINQFSKSQQKLLESIKAREDTKLKIRMKRPSTAKESRARQRSSKDARSAVQIEQIDEQEENEKSPRDYEKEIFEKLGIDGSSN